MKKSKYRMVMTLLSLSLAIPLLPITKISGDNSMKIISVNDYGADASGMKESGPAVARALEVAKAFEGPVEVQFNPGTYRITKEFAQTRDIHTSNTDSVDFPTKHIGILIEDNHNLTLNGQGAQILFEGNMMALAVVQSSNTTIQNLSWDFLVPTTSEMTVFDFDTENRTVDFFIPSYFNYEIQGNSILWKSELDTSGKPYWTERNGHRNYGIQVKYPTEMMGRSYYANQDPFHGVSNIETLPSGLLRFTYNSKPQIDPVLGMNYQLLSNTERSTAGALVWESKDVTFEDVKISYMHGFGLLVQMSENVYFNRLRMETDIETGKNTSSYADGIHVSGSKGKIEITNSFFNNTHDDPINIHGTFTRVEKRISDTTLQLNYIHKQQGGFPQFYPGDKVIFYSRDTLESKDLETEYTVKNVQGPDASNPRTMVVEFEERIPDYVDEKIGNEPKYVAENITYTPEILIKNNDFKNVFTRMILVTSRKKVIIEDNRFDAPTMPTLFFSNDSDEWYESGPIRDLEIRNNTFKIRSLGRTWWKYAPAIYFHPVTKGGHLPFAEHPIHKNILIEDNTFYLESDGVLRAESVENLTFRNNKVLRLNPEISLHLDGDETLAVGREYPLRLEANGNQVQGLGVLPNGPENNSGSVANVLEFKNSKNVIVEGNNYDDGLKKNVLIEGMEPHHYQINDVDLDVLTKRENRKPTEPVGAIYYVSTHPDIASVDAEGVIQTHRKGKTDIYAYTVWNDTLIKSNMKSITVDEIQTERLVFDEPIIHIDPSMDSISVLIGGETFDMSALTIQSFDEAIVSFEGGIPTIRKSGIAKALITYNEKEGIVYFVVDQPEDQLVLNPQVQIEDRNHALNLNTTSFTIDRENGQDLWENDNRLSNLVRVDLEPTSDEARVYIATMDGLPLRAQNSWDSSYMLLMKQKEDGTLDRDNYISMGKRAHADGIGFVQEINGQGKEAATNTIEDNPTTKQTFALEHRNNKVHAYVLNDEGFKHIHTFENIEHLGDHPVFAFAGWGNTQKNRTLEVSDIKAYRGSLFESSDIEPLKIQIPDSNTYHLETFEIMNAEANMYHVKTNYEGKTHVFVRNQEQINYVDQGRFPLQDGKTYDIDVIHQASSGKFSNRIHQTYTTQDREAYALIHNQKLEDQMILTVPADLLKLSYIDLNGTLQAVSIADRDSITLDNKHVYLNKIQSNEVEIQAIEPSFGNIDLSQHDTFVFTDTENTLDLKIKTSVPHENVTVVNEDHGIIKTVDETGSVCLDIFNGVTSYHIKAVAEDGVTTATHVIHILRNAPITPNRVEIRLGNETIASDANTIDFRHKFQLEDLSVDAGQSNIKTTFYDVPKENRSHSGIASRHVIMKVSFEDKRTVIHREFEAVNLAQKLNLEEIKRLIETVEGLSERRYTVGSWRNLQKVLNEVKDQLSLQALSQDVVDEGYIRLANAYQNLEEYKEENPTDKPIENPTDKPIEKPSERPNRKPETESLDHDSNENYLPLTGVSSKFDSIFLVGLGMALIVINRRRG
ncbi:pectate lyase [Erysipelothrix sp. strain 2 (EsS2-7-Brazil)]|uniref:alpha-1,3-galactosidase-related protein n=1 Tax=Erysipelothrix sp. strain 2 (EsS2-7-Brazil) TaxID=2500579 RepID=UPI001909ABAF|nr:pectate lyase [Erysipelothrix sp. strain 2 (EsS2-7-Brazil)]MBK2403510.1 pectate lyase [Erysipelothrix sp. strain 2 (EsS2-7-Brazil)]